MPALTAGPISISCNACGSGLYKLLGSTTGSRFVECRACGLQTVDPLPSDEQILQQYSNFYAARLVQEEFDEYTRLAESSLRYQLSCLQEFGAVLGDGCRFLDVGFGGGHYLQAAHRLGLHAFGVEIDGPSFERALQRGLKGIYQVQLKDAPFPAESFDLVKTLHVLEHARDPFGLLKDIRRVLKPEGWLVLDVPNQASKMARFKIGLRQLGLERRDFGYLQPPIHVYAFRPDVLLRMLPKAGFQVLKTVLTSPLDNRYFPTTSHYHRSLRDKLVKTLYRLIGDGSYMCVYARKA